MKKLSGHVAVAGTACAEAIVTGQPFGFFGAVDTRTGVITDQWHELHGQSIKGRVFVYPEGRGSTVGAAIILEMVRNQCAPAAILNNNLEIITVAGGILSKKFYGLDLPMMDRFDGDITSEIKSGDTVEVNTNENVIFVCVSAQETH